MIVVVTSTCLSLQHVTMEVDLGIRNVSRHRLSISDLATYLLDSVSSLIVLKSSLKIKHITMYHWESADPKIQCPSFHRMNFIEILN